MSLKPNGVAKSPQAGGYIYFIVKKRVVGETMDAGGEKFGREQRAKVKEKKALTERSMGSRAKRVEGKVKALNGS